MFLCNFACIEKKGNKDKVELMSENEGGSKIEEKGREQFSFTESHFEFNKKKFLHV